MRIDQTWYGKAIDPVDRQFLESLVDRQFVQVEWFVAEYFDSSSTGCGEHETIRPRAELFLDGKSSPLTVFFRSLKGARFEVGHD